MKIKHVKNNKKLENQIDSQSKTIPEQNEEYEFLELGKEYTAYGMILIKGQIWYYICDQAHDQYPVARPPNLFEITDNRLSRFWVYGSIEGFEKHSIWIFPEWLNEPYFQDNLTDGEERESQIFQQYKQLMDFEYPDSAIIETAQVGDNEWLICSVCIDAWQSSSSKDALVKCPKCHKVFNNPRYKNEFPHL